VGIAVKGLDHVHIRVADRARAAEWFKRVLGLQPALELGQWASDPAGPLFLATREGCHCLALVQGNTEQNRTGDHTVAFNVSASDFIGFLTEIDELQLVDRDGSQVTQADVADHDLSWSVYFLDPDGNRFELTSYEYQAIKARIHKPTQTL
jgi:catechol 2,3-dioxygenase-like lactoylglutathione lyase family enzyme